MTTLKKRLLMIFLTVLCALCLAFGLTACEITDDADDADPSSSLEQDNGDESENNENPETPSTEGTTPSTDETADGGDNTDEGATLGEITQFDGVTITIKDVTITLPESYEETAVSGGSTSSSTITIYSAAAEESAAIGKTITFEAGELYASVSETEEGYLIKAYADGAVTLSEDGYSETYAATLYGDGETLYVTYSHASDDDYSSKTFITFGYDYLANTFKDLMESEDMTAVLPAISIDEIASYITNAEITDESLLKLMTVLTSYSENVNALSESLFYSFFTTALADDGSCTATFDVDAVQSIVDDLYNLTISDLCDKYIGEGVLNLACTYLTSLGNEKVYDAITLLITSTGLDNETIFAIINMAVEQITGEEFDLNALLSGDSELSEQYADILAIKDMTIDELLTAYAGTTTTNIAAMISAVAWYKPFNMLFSTDAEATYAAITLLLSEIKDGSSFTITTYTDGSAEIALTLNGLAISYGDINIAASGAITLHTGADIPEYAAEITTVGDSTCTDIAAMLNGLLTDGKYQLTDDSYIQVSDTAITYTDGSATYTIAPDTELGGLLISDYGYGCSVSILYNDGAYDHNIALYLCADLDENENVIYGLTAYIVIYDEDGNVIYDGTIYDDFTDTVTQTYTYTYNEYGYVATENYVSSDGDSYAYTYTYSLNESGIGFLVTVTDQNGDTVDSYVIYY